MPVYDIAICKMDEEIIRLKGQPIDISFFLFKNDQESCSINRHIKSAEKMKLFLDDITEHNSTINLFTYEINAVALGAINGFINYVQPIVKEKDFNKASKRNLLVWIKDLGSYDYEPYGYYRHEYTEYSSIGLFFGRTVSKDELTVFDEQLL